MLPKERFEQLRTCRDPSGGVFGGSGVGGSVVVVVVVVVEVVVVGGTVVVVGATVVAVGTVVVEFDDGPEAMGDTARGIVVAGKVVDGVLVDVVLVDVVVDSTVVDVADAGTESAGPLEPSTTSGVVGGTPSSAAGSLGADVAETDSPADESPFTRTKLPRIISPPEAAPIIHKAGRRPSRPVACSSGNPVLGSAAPKVG